ncbi:glycosyltransferase family 2 protein [Enterococcus bulliens]
MISVCLVTYNGAFFLKQQLDSILIQLADEDEVLISDDGSTDETLSIIDAYHDPRIQLFQGPRQGVIKNVEFVLQQAQGEFIFLADQDDIWHPDKVKKMIAVFKNNPKVQVVVSDLVIVDEHAQVLHASYFDYRQVKAGFFQNILKNSFIGAAMAFRRELLQTAFPFPNHLPMHDMWLGLIAVNQVYFLAEPLVDYRRHEKNASEIATTSSFKQKLVWRYHLICALILRLIFKK